MIRKIQGRSVGKRRRFPMCPAVEMLETRTLLSASLVKAPPAFINSDEGTLVVGVEGKAVIKTSGSPPATLYESGTLPAGLSWLSKGNGRGVIYGNAAAGSEGVYEIKVTAINHVRPRMTETFTLTVGSAPTIQSANQVTLTAGVGADFPQTAVGYPMPTFVEKGALPEGLSWSNGSDGTAVLSGTPAAGTTGTYTVIFNANNGVKPHAHQVFSLTVAQTPQFIGPDHATFAVGTAGSFTVETSGFPAPALAESGALPNGLSWVDNGDGTATLSGTPAAGTNGNYSLTFTANNGSSADVTQDFTLNVAASVTAALAPTITSSPSTSFTVGGKSSFTIKTSGYPAAALTETGTLPDGILFQDNGDGTATLSGTPSAGSAGIYPLTVKAANGTLPDATQDFTLTIAAASTGTPPSPKLVGQLSTSANAVQMAYSPNYNLLFLRNSGSEITVLNSLTGATVSSQLATNDFSDMSLTPDGKFLYVADYGGTNIGYDTPSGTSYVDRYDVVNNTWTVLPAPKIAFHVAAIDDNDFLLMEEDQWVNMTLNTWGSTSITQDASTSGDYESDFAYDPTTGRVIYGNSGDSSTEIFADRIVNGQFNAQENSGIYGSAQGYGGTDVLSTDDKEFYYGGLQVNALDVSQNLQVFPQDIIAATANIAFGATSYYDAQSGASLGSYGFTAQAIALSPTGSDAWMYANGKVYHYTMTAGPMAPMIVSSPSTTFTVGDDSSFTINTSGSPAAALTETGTLPDGILFQDNGDGTATLSGTPAAGSAGVYPLTLKAANGTSPDATQNFTLTIAAASTGSPTALQLVGQLSTSANAVQMAYSPNYNLLFLRNSGSEITVINSLTGATVSTQLATSKFSDMSLTPDGKYLYAADYGGTIIGYDQPSSPSYVDRYDVANNTWTVLPAPKIAFHVAAIDDNDFLLMEEDQWVNMTLNTWGSTSITQDASTSGDYESDFAYDPTTGRVIYGNSGDSSAEIFADRIVNGQFHAQENSGIYGSAQGYGGTDVLSTDDKEFYYGELQVNALDVTENLHVFPQDIIAASANIAFGATSFYDAQSGAFLGSYGFTAQAIALSPSGGDIWMYANGKVYHFNPAVGQAPAFSSANTVVFSPGVLGSYTITTTGSPSATILESGTLPQGVMFINNQDGTATVYGKPAVGSDGTYVLTLTASNGLIPNATQTFTLTVG